MTETSRFHLQTTLVGDPNAPVRAVFMHGLFGRGRNFSRIAAGLEPEAQSLLVDLPNHGGSDWTEHFDYSDVADLVADHLRGGFAASGPVDVIGHSMGGKVAMVLALRHPELVRRLVVVDISPVSAASSRGEFEHLLGALASLDLSTVHRRAEADAALTGQIPNAVVRGFLLQNLKPEGEGYAWEPNLQLLNGELTRVMAFPDFDGTRFTRPVLWIKGANSEYITDDEIPAMRALFPETRLVAVPGAGHWVHSEQPAVVIEALRSFLLAES